MPDAIWVDDDAGLTALAGELAAQSSVGLDTEFMRERTYFPQLCLVQVAAGGRIWCIDTLAGAALDALVAPLAGAAVRKVVHAARQDLEAIHVHAGCIVAPVFDTQVAAGCAGLKPQIGYAELVQQLLGITVPKGQTRTDWSRRPLSAAQLHYAAEDVLYLGPVAEELSLRLAGLGRMHWVLEDCRALSDPAQFSPDPLRAGDRLRGLGQLEPRARHAARALAAWRETEARMRNVPRPWIMPDAVILAAAQSNPQDGAALRRLAQPEPQYPPALIDGAVGVLREAYGQEPADVEPARDARPTPEQRELAALLARRVDARAAELGISAEILAPRGELKNLALGERDTPCLRGWRREAIGADLLACL